MQKKTILLRSNILNQAFKLFLEKGYDDVTTREIAASSGIERGVLYYHYNQKQDILFELYSQFYSCLCEAIFEQYSNRHPMVVVMLADLLLYRVLLTKKATKRLFYSILRNREMVKEKINSTSQIIWKYGTFLNYSDLKLAITIAIGAEVELILQCEEGDISMSLDEISRHVGGLAVYKMGYSDKDTEEFFQEALQVAASFDYSGFVERMMNSCSWFKMEEFEKYLNE